MHDGSARDFLEPNEGRGADARPIRGAIARALSWTALESLGLSGLSFLTLLILAHYLTPADFGIASMALGIVQVLNIPVEMLFHDALIQRSSANRQHFDTAFTASVLLGIALCLLCWALAPLAASALGTPQMATVLPWMSTSLPLMGFGSTIIAFQRRHLLYRPLAIRSLVGRLMGATAGIAFAMSGGGVWSLVVQQVASVGCATVALWLGSNWRPRLHWSQSELKELLAFGLPAMSVMGMYFVGQRWFMLLAGRELGAASAGYLNLAFRSIDSLRDVSAGAVSQLALPLFSRRQHDPAALAAGFRKATAMSCALMFPVFGSLTVCAPDFVHLLFGPKWQSAAQLIALMALLTAHYYSRLFAAPLMSAVRKPHYPLPGQFAQLALVTTFMLQFGGTSVEVAAAIWALRLLLSTPIDIWFMHRATGLRAGQQLAGIVAPLSAAIAMVAFEWQLRVMLGPGGTPLTVLAGVVVPGLSAYFVVLYWIDSVLCRELLAFARQALTSSRGTIESAAR